VVRAEDAAAERAFARLCGEYLSGTVGVWREAPVVYGLLAKLPPVTFTPEQFAALGWDRLGRSYDACLRELDAGNDRVAASRRQMLGWAGHITFDARYRVERDALCRRDHDLGGVLTWPLTPRAAEARVAGGAATDRDPLASLDGPGPVGTALILSPDAARQLGAGAATLPWGRSAHADAVRLLVADAVGFLARWDLARLVTWELPEPQGPVDHLPAGAAGLLNPNQPVSVRPAYLNPPPAEDLRRQQLTAQRAAAREVGQSVRGPAAGIAGRDGRPSQNEMALRLWLVEGAVRARYGNPRGLVARLTDAFCTQYALTRDSVMQIRRLYTSMLPAAG
jgi:hypothetical protein